VCFTLHVYDLQHEAPHDGISTKGECSFMEKDGRLVMGTLLNMADSMSMTSVMGTRPIGYMQR
jgi:hypothetical protein